MHVHTRLAFGLVTTTAVFLLAATSGEALVKPPRGGFGSNPGVEIDPEPPPPPPQPTAVPPIARPGIQVVERGSSSVTIKWCDNSAEEESHVLFRGTTPESADDTVVATLVRSAKSTGLKGSLPGKGKKPPAKTGCQQHVDTGLAPDTQYCFRTAPKRGGAIEIDYISGTVCAYTREAQSKPVWRIELELRTDSRSGKGTDDPVRIQLNAAPSGLYGMPTYLPSGNFTWLDYGRDDFERGAVDGYDLNLTGISERGDIHSINFAIDGDDTWCMSGFALLVNGVEVYNESFLPSCLVSEDWGTYQTNFYYVSHDDLRAHPLWQAYRTPQLVDAADALQRLGRGESVEVLTLPRQEIESRIEGSVGHSISFNSLEWGDRVGLRHVEATATTDPQVAHLDLDLEADVPVLNNPAVDVQFDLRFSMSCRADGTGIDFQFETENFTTDASAGLFTRFVGYLFCAYDPQCEPGLLSYIESQVRAGFTPLARTISLQSAEAVGACALGYLPTVVVTEDADVVISIEPGNAPPPPNPTPTPRPYGNIRDVFRKAPGGLLTRF